MIVSFLNMLKIKRVIDTDSFTFYQKQQHHLYSRFLPTNLITLAICAFPYLSFNILMPLLQPVLQLLMLHGEVSKDMLPLLLQVRLPEEW